MAVEALSVCFSQTRKVSDQHSRSQCQNKSRIQPRPHRLSTGLINSSSDGYSNPEGKTYASSQWGCASLRRPSVRKAISSMLPYRFTHKKCKEATEPTLAVLQGLEAGRVGLSSPWWYRYQTSRSPPGFCFGELSVVC